MNQCCHISDISLALRYCWARQRLRMFRKQPLARTNVQTKTGKSFFASILLNAGTCLPWWRYRSVGATCNTLNPTELQMPRHAYSTLSPTLMVRVVCPVIIGALDIIRHPFFIIRHGSAASFLELNGKSYASIV